LECSSNPDNVKGSATGAIMAGIVLAIGLACFLRETGRASRPTVPLVLAAKAPS
jgi:hypothetical protein